MNRHIEALTQAEQDSIESRGVGGCSVFLPKLTTPHSKLDSLQYKLWNAGIYATIVAIDDEKGFAVYQLDRSSRSHVEAIIMQAGYTPVESEGEAK